MRTWYRLNTLKVETMNPYIILSEKKHTKTINFVNFLLSIRYKKMCTDNKIDAK